MTAAKCSVCGECEACPDCGLPMCTHDDGDCEYAAMVAHAISDPLVEEPAVAIIREASPTTALEALTWEDLDVLNTALRAYAKAQRAGDANGVADPAEADVAERLRQRVIAAKAMVRS